MAFEQNQQLQKLLNPMNMQMPQSSSQGQGYGQQFPQPRPAQPQMGFAPLNNQNGWGDTFKNFFLGTPERQYYSSPFSQNQSQGLEQLLGMGLQNQQNPYGGWEDLRNSILSDYQQNILPNILERFTGMGGGSLSSPDFAKQVTAGNQGLMSMLLAHKANLGQQNRQFGLQQSQAGLRPQFESAYSPRQPGALEDIWNTGKNITQQAIPFALRALAGGL